MSANGFWLHLKVDLARNSSFYDWNYCDAFDHRIHFHRVFIAIKCRAGWWWYENMRGQGPVGNSAQVITIHHHHLHNTGPKLHCIFVANSVPIIRDRHCCCQFWKLESSVPLSYVGILDRLVFCQLGVASSVVVWTTSFDSLIFHLSVKPGQKIQSCPALHFSPWPGRVTGRVGGEEGS